MRVVTKSFFKNKVSDNTFESSFLKNKASGNLFESLFLNKDKLIDSKTSTPLKASFKKQRHVIYQDSYKNDFNPFESMPSTQSLPPFSNPLCINDLMPCVLVSTGFISGSMVKKASNGSDVVVNQTKLVLLPFKEIPFYLTYPVYQNMIGCQFFIKILF